MSYSKWDIFLQDEFKTKEYRNFCAKLNVKRKRTQPQMLKRFEWLKQFLLSNWLIYENKL